MKDVIKKIRLNDRIMYTLNGFKHRDDGPAVIYDTGSKAYYYYNKLHREDGPAIIYFDGEERWYINNIRLSEEEFNQYLLQKNLSKI